MQQRAHHLKPSWKLGRKSIYAALLGTSAALASLCGFVADHQSELHRVRDGWTESGEYWREHDPYLLSSIPSEWVGQGRGRVRLLYQDYRIVLGQTYDTRSQGNAPSCVGQAAAAGVDFLAAVEIAQGQPERLPPARVAVEPIYGLSRIEVGGLGPAAGGGSHCLWACQAMQRYGVVFQQNYALIGYDLTKYSTDLCKDFGRNGVPESIELLSKIHPVQDYIQINSYEELRDAIYQGCPVIIGSNVGFGKKSGARRDSEGYLTPPWFTAPWAHAMVCIGMADDGRPGGLILNSWGHNWISGPQKFGDEPNGSFWVDKRVLERMISQGDAYALRSFQGFPHYKLYRETP